MRLAISLLLLVCTVACTPAAVKLTPISDLPTASPSLHPSATSRLLTSTLHTSTPNPDSLPTAAALQAFEACSPLESYELAQLPELVSNAFNPPPPGSDDPHHGVDLADLLPGSQVAVSGRRVQAVLPGQVAGIIIDRFPYGNALLVETPLDRLPAAWLDHLYLPQPAEGAPVHTSLTCPPEALEPWPDQGERSLYLLYAHLEETPALQAGDWVACGQAIGSVGMSGNALNPHLHLEVRVGPSGAGFTSLAHYDPGATLEEMAAYCTWRVGGRFIAIDPLNLFLPAP